MITIETRIITTPGEVLPTVTMPPKTKIVAWAYSNEDKGGYIPGHLDGTQLYFDLGTSQEDIYTAVNDRYQEMVRVFNKFNNAWNKKHG